MHLGKLPLGHRYPGAGGGFPVPGRVPRQPLRRQGDDRGKLENLDAINIVDYVIAKPKTVERDASASEALRIMEVNGITSLAILDSRGKPEGIIHIHDILGRAKFMV